MKNKKAASKGFMIYIGVIIFLFVALIIAIVGDKMYVAKMSEDLSEELQVDETRNESIVQCDDGSYDVYRPLDEKSTLCGYDLWYGTIPNLN